MLPEKNRPEWKLLVKGDKDYPLRNFVLQMKVAQTAKDIKTGKVTIDKAVDEIYSLCKKYEKAVHKDVETIFNS